MTAPIVLDLTAWKRVARCLRAAPRPAFKTVRWLLLLMLPLSLLVTLLDHAGVLPLLAVRLAPVMRLLGLPGEAALVVVSAMLLNIYSAIAVMQTMTLTMRQATILALVCLLAHNLPVETAVQRRAGASIRVVLCLRLAAALAGGLLLNLLLPQCALELHAARVAQPAAGLTVVLLGWSNAMLRLALKVVLIVLGLTALQRVLLEFGVAHRLARRMRPLLLFFGLPESTAFLWLAANLMGLAFGAAVIVEQVDTGRIAARDVRLFHCHAALAHSLLEDTLLFAALGISAAWIIWPRLLLALPAVWGYRLWHGRRPAAAPPAE